MKRSPNQFNMRSSKMSEGRKPQYSINPSHQPLIGYGTTATFVSNTNNPSSGNTATLRKRASQMDNSTYGKQQNIIGNLRSELTNLKQEVAKLMHKEQPVLHNELEKSRNSQAGFNISSLGSSPFHSISRTESLDYRQKQQTSRNEEKSNRLGGTDPSQKAPSTFQDNTLKASLTDHQKLNSELKNAYTRQKQLLKERAHLLQALSKQRSKNQNEKDINILRRSYNQQIEELKTLQTHLQQQVETKNKIVQNERQRYNSMQTELSQKINEHNNEILSKNKQIGELRKQLLEERKKKPNLGSSTDVNRAEPDYSGQIARLKLKLSQTEEKLEQMTRKIKQSEELLQVFKQKDNQIHYLEGILKLTEQQNSKKIEKLNSELSKVMNDFKRNQSTIEQLQKDLKIATDQKSSLKEEYEAKLRQNSSIIEDLNKSLKQNELLLLNINSHSGKKRHEDEQLKCEIKSKDKTINNLINDVKHLEHDLRHANFNKGMCKSMGGYIDQNNEEQVLGHLKRLNQKYKKTK